MIDVDIQKTNSTVNSVDNKTSSEQNRPTGDTSNKGMWLTRCNQLNFATGNNFSSAVVMGNIGSNVNVVLTNDDNSSREAKDTSTTDYSENDVFSSESKMLLINQKSCFIQIWLVILSITMTSLLPKIFSLCCFLWFFTISSIHLSSKLIT